MRAKDYDNVIRVILKFTAQPERVTTIFFVSVNAYRHLILYVKLGHKLAQKWLQNSARAVAVYFIFSCTLLITEQISALQLSSCTVLSLMMMPLH